MKQLAFIALTLASGFAWIPMAQAVDCAIEPTQPALITTVALQGGNITVGQDVPNGTVLFRQYFKASRQPQVRCQSNPVSWSWTLQSLYGATPKPLTTWNSGMWAGKLYESGIPGIGVAAWFNGTAFPSQRGSATVNANLNYSFFPDGQFDISFVKIGPIAPGVIRGQDLPTVVMDFLPNGGTKVRMVSVGYSGTLNVVSQTCTTPNPVVQLGKYDIASTFKGVGSITGWAIADINLTNCPRFYGTMNDGQNNYGSDSSTDRGKAGTPQPNTLGVTLKPNTAIIDAAKGIMGLKSEPNVATGVGIQLATAVAGAGGTPVIFNSEKSYTTSNSASTTYNIPLFARYYQTDAKVTPGPANGAVTYTINYY